MHSMSLILTGLFAFALSTKIASVSAVNPIVVDGTILKDSVTNERFFVHGAGYDYEVDDAAYDQWKPALDLLIATVPNLNAIRFYEAEPGKSYAKFLEYTNTHGLYLFVPLTPAGDGTSKFSHCAMAADSVPAFPQAEGETTCYPSCLLEFGQRVVNIFSQAPNTLTYMIGNEVIDKESRWAAAPCVKAYTRDIKAYQRSCSSALRYVPISYADADNSTPTLKAEANNRLKSDYLTCGQEAERIDMYAYNMFRWCSSTCTYETCGWKQVHDAMSGAGVPIVLTEHGCGTYYKDSKLSQREWKEVPVLYSSQMTDVISGGNAYSYGIRGDKGEEKFSFFEGGSMLPDGFPGATKSCSGGSCNADNYSTQLNLALAAGIPSSAARSNRFTTDPVCPTYKSFDLTIAETRQGAPGYTQVTCPVKAGTKPPTGSVSSSTGTKVTPAPSSGSSTGAASTQGSTSTPVDSSTTDETSIPSTEDSSSTAADEQTGGDVSAPADSTAAADGTDVSPNTVNPTSRSAMRLASRAFQTQQLQLQQQPQQQQQPQLRLNQKVLPASLSSASRTSRAIIAQQRPVSSSSHLQHQNQSQSQRPLQFAHRIKYETRFETDQRLSKGLSAAQQNLEAISQELHQRPDHLLHHRRQSTREAMQEVARLNAELHSLQQEMHAATKRQAAAMRDKDAHLERVSTDQAAVRAVTEDANRTLQQVKQSRDDVRRLLAEAQRAAQSEQKRQAAFIASLQASHSQLNKDVAHRDDQIQHLESTVVQLEQSTASLQQSTASAQTQLAIAHKVRDELVEKLEHEESFGRYLATQLDLILSEAQQAALWGSQAEAQTQTPNCEQ